jgi:hypothetical protein
VGENPAGLTPPADEQADDNGADSAGFGFGFDDSGAADDAGADSADFGFGFDDSGTAADDAGVSGGDEGADSADFGFGFDDGGAADDEGADSAGFGFGFDGGGAADDAGVSGGDEGAAWSIDGYTAADLIALLDTAASQKGAMSGSELVKQLKRLANYDGLGYYEIPTDPARYGMETDADLQRLVSNYLLLLSGGDFGSYANDPLEPTAIRTMIQLKTKGDRDTRAAVGVISAYIDENFPAGVKATIGGNAMIESAVTALIVDSQITSIAISIFMVFLIMSLSYRSAIAGLIGAIPLSIAILGNFAVMGFVGIKLNIGTALIASLAVGIGIDYTIHFIDSFKREYERGGDFLRRTFTSSGKAIIINAVSVGAGFGVLALSRFKMLSEFGGLIALSMAISALVSLTLIPVLLMMLKPRFIYGKNHE